MGSYENGDVDKTAQSETECIERICLFVVICQMFVVSIFLFFLINTFIQ